MDALTLRQKALIAIVFHILPLLLVHELQYLKLVDGQTSSPPFACDTHNANYQPLPFCDTSLSAAERVADLVGRLTLDEKIQQLVNNAVGVSRLGIPKYEWWSEALHGVSNVGPGTRFTGSISGATSFPQVILTAASFSGSLWKQIGQVVSTEARAMYNLGTAGLTYWSPNVNIFRDPRWGRGQETPGEDPTLASHYAANYVRGLQDSSSDGKLKVSACCKHYTAYDLDNWNGIDRFHFDAKVSAQDLEDTYQPPFKSCIADGDASCIMCSYNRVNGVPTCVDKNLLLGVVRKQWGLNGYIASDCDSVEVLYDAIHYTPSPEDAVADSILAGLNMNCGTFLAQFTGKAVTEGKLKESDIDESLKYLYAVLLRLGFFDGDPTKQEYGNLGAKDVCTSSNLELALDAARKGIVLMKNSGGALPLSKTKVAKLAVIGPNAKATDTMIGNYAGVPCKYTTPVDGLSKYATVDYQPGCSNVACTSDSLISAAVQAASTADAVVLVMGLDQSQEREGFDRNDLLFPGHQADLITQVSLACVGPVILVIMSGGPLDISFVQNNPKVSSILWAGYPGGDGGQAIAEVIFGDHNPSGRSPFTWYPNNYTASVSMADMSMRASSSAGQPGRTYRFYQGPTLFKFGDGLSYTTFSHSIGVSTTPKELTMSLLETHPSCINTTTSSSSCSQLVHTKHAACETMDFPVAVDVENKGAMDSHHSLLLFSHPPASQLGGHAGAPIKQLVAFDNIHLPAGTKQRVIFNLNACHHLSTINEKGEKVVIIGSHGLSVGDAKHYMDLSVVDNHFR